MMITVHSFSRIPFLSCSGNFIRTLNKEKRLFFNTLGRLFFFFFLGQQTKA